MKFRYIITTEMNHELEDYRAKDKEDLLRRIKEHIEIDPEFIFEALDKFSIDVEPVE